MIPAFKLILSLAASALVLILAGCSSKGSYEAIQKTNQMDCGKLPSSQYEECMQRNSMSYEEYAREREKVMGEESQ